MRKTLLVLAIVLLGSPTFAQDDFGGGFGGGFDGVLTGGDIDALLGGGRGNRGNNNNNNNIPNPEQLFLQLKDLLKARKLPLTKDQEKSLRTFLDAETVAMRTDLEAQFQNRGGNRGNNNNTVNILSEVFGLVTKHNTELLTEMKADLTPDQVNLIAKAEKDKKVCSVMLDMFNPQQLQNRNQGNRGGNNNQNFNLPIGIDGFDFGGGQDPRQRGNNNNNSFLQAIPDRAFCTTSTSTTAERLTPISQILSKGKKPLTADQEKKFSGLIEARVPVMQQEMRDKDPRMASLINDINNSQRNNNFNNNNFNNNNNPPAVNAQQLRNNIVNTVMTQLGLPNNNNNNNNNNRGGRGGNNNNNNPAGAPNNNAATPNNANATAANNNDNNRGGRGNNNNNNFNPQAEIQKKNEELYDKIAAKLNPDQAVVIKKVKYDQIKAKGGAERYRGIMEEEGTPLTPEQVTQIQSLFNVQNRAVREFAEQLVQQEMDKAATLEPPPPPANQQNQNRPNPNNVNQNPVAQQIVAKVMPEVSRRHAILERSLTDTIMKVLTPAQVASYKLNSL